MKQMLILGLKEINLPNEWFSAKGDTLIERFQSTYKAMAPGPFKPNSVAGLISRYENQGNPFVHTVWLNKPMRCRHCNDGGADGFYTVVSVRNGLSITVSAEEMHLVLEHGGKFTNEKIAQLNALFASLPIKS